MQRNSNKKSQKLSSLYKMAEKKQQPSVCMPFKQSIGYLCSYRHFSCRDMQMFDRVRGQDINILRGFSVKYIVDLMVEKKKVKFGLK